MGGGDAPASDVDMGPLTPSRNIQLCIAPMRLVHTGEIEGNVGIAAAEYRRAGKTMLQSDTRLERKTFRKMSK
jgi:hypothetical protein